MSLRTLVNTSPRQSPRSASILSILSDADVSALDLELVTTASSKWRPAAKRRGNPVGVFCRQSVRAGRILAGFCVCPLCRLVFCKKFPDRRDKLGGNFHHGFAICFKRSLVLGDSFRFSLAFVVVKCRVSDVPNLG